jgi:hypothetical protein
MTPDNSNVDFWSLSFAQLAARVGSIAHGDPAEFDDATRTEANLLCEEWQDAFNLPTDTLTGQQQRAARLGSLQKRTVEVLIKLSLDE